MNQYSGLSELFELSQDETTLFTLSLKHKSLTVVQLSKISGIPRTQIYRLCDSLMAKGILTKVIGDKTSLYQPESQSKLEQLAEDKTKRLAQAKQALPDLFSSFTETNATTGTEVKFYQGSTGICQMIWHMVDTKGELVGYTFRDLAPITGEDFANDFYAEVVNRHIRIRDLYSDSYVESVGGIEKAKLSTFPHPDWPKLVTSRYIAPKLLPIPHQLDIYNDTVAFYNWFQGEVFGVEIINPKVAAMQRALFEMAWNIAK